MKWYPSIVTAKDHPMGTHLTFCPSSVTSLTPLSDSILTCSVLTALQPE